MTQHRETTSRNPATGEIVGTSILDSRAELQAAIRRARVVQSRWAALSAKNRGRYLLRVRDHLVARADDLADVISRDNGKTRVDALLTEVLPAAMAIGYYVRNAKRFLRSRWLRPANVLLMNKISKVVRVPYGVIGIISPWNYPFAIPFSEVVMGLLAGNTVVLKTASETQMVGRALEASFQAAGLPDGVFQYVNLPGREAGNVFLESGVDKLFFTGSTTVGKQLMAKAAETLTPLCLELGGNDPMLVCMDADLDRAAAGAVWAGFQNAGQSCGGVERIYVQAAVYQSFLDSLAAKVRALRVGPDRDHRVDIGAMTTTKQMDVVRRHVEDAVSRGAVIYAQSACPADSVGNFMPAMVLTEVDHSMRVMREETFGPVVGVMRVASMEEAVRLANDSNLGLTASVWSRDRGRAEELARLVQAGVVMINDHLMSHGLAETPWGGFKESGIGRTHGRIGFEEMTRPQCIVHDYMPAVKKNMWWHPHGPEVYRGLRGILDALYTRQADRRFRGLVRLLQLFGRTFRP